MYPLLQLGPLSLSTGGLLLLAAALLFSELLGRTARARGGAALAQQAEACLPAALVGAALGGRLWYGLFAWELYGRDPWLFLALRIAELAWPGALLGALLASWLWCRWRGFDIPALADAAALSLPPAQALAAMGLLLSGEAFGAPAELPWAVELFGAARHPTQLYYAAAALLSWAALRFFAGGRAGPGALAAAALGLGGIAMLVVEPLRADAALITGGLRAGQLFGLALLLGAMIWARRAAPPAVDLSHTPY